MSIESLLNGELPESPKYTGDGDTSTGISPLLKDKFPFRLVYHDVHSLVHPSAKLPDYKLKSSWGASHIEVEVEGAKTLSKGLQSQMDEDSKQFEKNMKDWYDDSEYPDTHKKMAKDAEEVLEKITSTLKNGGVNTGDDLIKLIKKLGYKSKIQNERQANKLFNESVKINQLAAYHGHKEAGNYKEAKKALDTYLNT
jgi:hypothetical protein